MIRAVPWRRPGSQRYAGGLAALGLWTGLAVVGCGEDPGLPVYRVEMGELLHRITADGELEAARTVQLTVPSTIRSSVTIAWIAPEGSQVEEGEVVLRFDAVDMQKRLEDGNSALAKVRLEMERSRIQGDQTLTQLEKDHRLAELELEHARRFRRTDSEVFARQDILEDAIDEQLASERQKNAEQAMANQTGLQGTELDILKIRERQALAMIQQAEQGLSSLEMKAPHTGILVYVRDWRGDPPQVGKNLWPGQQVAEIPDLSELEAQVYVLEADAGGLEPELLADVVVQAHPDRVLGGKVARVEPVAKPRIPGSPVRYFAVDITFDDSALADGEGGAHLRPGQRVRSTLLVARQEDVLTVPRQAIFGGSEGNPRVWVRASGRFESRPVELGASNLGRVVIESGLDEGDVVALAEPADQERSEDPVDVQGDGDPDAGGDDAGENAPRVASSPPSPRPSAPSPSGSTSPEGGKEASGDGP
ncbi:MAG: efflux RND transporter periplasmic adaptor subunit [Holophagales bacterium]|nr:efflux RND transporter periplasmic adaptor subunit [Holophagales bacterium]